MNKKSPQI